MGRRGGGILSHLSDTKKAVERWLEYEQPNPVGGGQNNLLALAMEDTRETPEQPEVIAVIRESRRFGVPIFSGALRDWPWIAKQELNTAINTEQDYLARIEANARLLANQVNNGLS